MPGMIEYTMPPASPAFDARLGFRPAELAAMLGVRPATALAWIYSGELPATRLGRSWLVPREAVQQLLSLPPGWQGTGGRYL
jgi:excisionase family DNA binding protein